MVVPSEFPWWFAWIYNFPFGTYSFRVFVYKEFVGVQAFGYPANATFPNGGQSVLELYQIQDINPGLDMVVLFGWALALHAVCIGLLSWRFR